MHINIKKRRIELQKKDTNDKENEIYSLYLRNMNNFEYIYTKLVFFIYNCFDYSISKVKGNLYFNFYFYE